MLKNFLNQLTLQAFCHQMSHNYLLKWGQVFCYVNNVLVLFINLILFMTFSTSLKLIIIYWSLWERNQLTRDFYTGLANKVDPLKICRKSLDWSHCGFWVCTRPSLNPSCCIRVVQFSKKVTLLKYKYFRYFIANQLNFEFSRQNWWMRFLDFQTTLVFSE